MSTNRSATYPALGISALLDGFQQKQFSPVEMTQEALAQAKKYAHLNALVAPMPEQALASACESEARYARNTANTLDGIPIAHKDVFCVENVQTTAASRILESFVPPYSATVVARLAAQGATTIGMLNCDEFAMGSANVNSRYGPALNPWQAGEPRVPGGSSGGSAAAVAAGIVPIATGTDTGGSIRQPASFCGVVGFKPTYGRCSRFGITAFASSLDQAGILARSVYDAGLTVSLMAGHDPNDMLTTKRSAADFCAELDQASKGNKDIKCIKGLKVGIPQEYRAKGLDPDIQRYWEQAAAWLHAQGATIVDTISLPHTDVALAAYYVICMAEASSNLARYDGIRYGQRAENAANLQELYCLSRSQGFGDEVKRRILIGTYVLSVGLYDAYYRKAQQVRARVAQDFDHAFTQCDVLLAPATPTVAFPMAHMPSDPVQIYLNDIYTVPTSLAGLPAITVPVGLSREQLPIGLQLIGQSFAENTLLKAATALENAAQFTHTPDRHG